MKVPDDFLPSDDLIPDGSILLHGVFVVEYLTPDGDSRYTVEAFGTSRTAESVGLVEVGKMLLMQALEERREDDEDDD